METEVRMLHQTTEERVREIIQEVIRENVDSAFGRLRYDKVFADVTLACEDGQQMDAHKVILAASSPIFEEILQRNKHPHPMIYMRGFQSKHFASTRPKPAYGRQGLDWIVGPRYSLWCSEPTKLWKPTKNHEKPYNHLEKPWKPTKNHETTLKPP